jgi:hypothetical protein
MRFDMVVVQLTPEMVVGGKVRELLSLKDLAWGVVLLELLMGGRIRGLG